MSVSFSTWTELVWRYLREVTNTVTEFDLRIRHIKKFSPNPNRNPKPNLPLPNLHICIPVPYHHPTLDPRTKPHSDPNPNPAGKDCGSTPAPKSVVAKSKKASSKTTTRGAFGGGPSAFGAGAGGTGSFASAGSTLQSMAMGYGDLDV